MERTLVGFHLFSLFIKNRKEPVFLRVRVNPWKTGRNKEATGTERVKGIPWNDFRGSTEHVPYIPLPVKILFSTELTRPVLRGQNAVPRNKICVFPPFLQLLTFSNFNFGNKKITPSKLVPPFVSLLPWEKRDLSTDEKILTPASTEYPSGPISFNKKDSYFFILFKCITI